MSPEAAPERGSLVEELSAQRCADLLAAHHIGRVAFSAADGPHLLPVAYVFWSQAVVFRTSESGALSVLQNRFKVAFEIDHIDVASGTAWDVEVRGATRKVWNSHELEPLWQHPHLTPWVPGPRSLVIAIEPDVVSGRQIWFPGAQA